MEQMYQTKDHSNKAWHGSPWHLWTWVVFCLQFHGWFFHWPWCCKQLHPCSFFVAIFQSDSLCSMYNCSFDSSWYFRWHGSRSGSTCLGVQKQQEGDFLLRNLHLWSNETSLSTIQAPPCILLEIPCWQPHHIQFWIHHSNLMKTRQSHLLSRIHHHLWRRGVDL